MHRIAFLLVPGVHLLDLAGPAQVFSTAARDGLPYRLTYIADHPAGDGSGGDGSRGDGSRGEQCDVVTAQGVALRAPAAWPDLTRDDIVVVPGWRWAAPREADARHAPPVSPGAARRLAGHHAAGGLVASVCSGAFALAHAGLLDGRRCTTHHELQDALARRHP
ncbi:DJ-1/PfpI family protein, partial [Actinomadura sp. 6K520]|uniref:DJ-1/PfpI family protein n=1 Tax=Actinomadura sp. 6K520 TaxID=2530364 RepID=UPI0010D62ADF